jgi:hypothetical protein
MAYIGNIPAEKFTSVDIQNFTVSATANYTLDRPVANENEIELFINNVRQHPGSGKAYTASGTALTLSEATAGTDTMYCVYQGKARQTVTPATSSVTNAMLAGSIDLTSKVTGALPQANIADQAINEAKLQISNAPTNGYMLTAQSGNTGGLTWAAAPSATGLTHITTVSGTSAVSSVLINDCFSSTYKTYKLFGTVLVDTDDTKLEMQYTKSSGSTVGDQGYRYVINLLNLHSDSSRSDASTGNWSDTGGAELVYAIDTDATYSPVQFEMTFYDPGQHFASYQYFDGRFTYLSSGHQFRIGTLGGQYRENFNATGLKFKTDSNNFSRYYFNVYGITNSGS